MEGGERETEARAVHHACCMPGTAMRAPRRASSSSSSSSSPPSSHAPRAVSSQPRRNQPGSRDASRRFQDEEDGFPRLNHRLVPLFGQMGAGKWARHAAAGLARAPRRRGIATARRAAEASGTERPRRSPSSTSTAAPPPAARWSHARAPRNAKTPTHPEADPSSPRRRAGSKPNRWMVRILRRDRRVRRVYKSRVPVLVFGRRNSLTRDGSHRQTRREAAARDWAGSRVSSPSTTPTHGYVVYYRVDRDRYCTFGL